MMSAETTAANDPGPARRVAITGLGVVSAVGAGVERCLERLLEGDPPYTALDGRWGDPGRLGAPVGELDSSRWIAPRRLRRMNQLSRTAVVAAMQALEQSGLEPSASTGVVIGTGLGALEDTCQFIRQIQDDDPSQASPALFPTTVMNVAASQISMALGLQGYNTTVNHKEISGELALLVAVEALRVGRADGLLCGGVDELTGPVHHGYRRLGGLAAGRNRPYAVERDGVVLGEGAAVMMLEAMAEARGRGADVLAEVAGVAATGGDRPMVAWGPGPEQGRVAGPALEAAVAALQGALEQSEMTPRDIDLVVGSGSGSPDLDRLDGEAIAAVFGDRAVPVTSPHGTLGTWMASGALRLVSAVAMLRRQEIYPTVMDGAPDPALRLPGLVTRRQPARLRAVLVCGHASGGGSAAAVLVA